MKMKILFLLPVLLLSLISCSIETDSVVERDGLYYEDLANSIIRFHSFYRGSNWERKRQSKGRKERR